MSPEQAKRRPVGIEAAFPAPNKSERDSTSHSTRTFAIIVRRELVNGGTRSFIYRTTHAAEKALARAAKVNLAASVEFVELVPVGAPTPAQLAALEGGNE